MLKRKVNSCIAVRQMNLPADKPAKRQANHYNLNTLRLAVPVHHNFRHIRMSLNKLLHVLSIPRSRLMGTPMRLTGQGTFGFGIELVATLSFGSV